MLIYGTATINSDLSKAVAILSDRKFFPLNTCGNLVPVLNPNMQYNLWWNSLQILIFTTTEIRTSMDGSSVVLNSYKFGSCTVEFIKYYGTATIDYCDVAGHPLATGAKSLERPGTKLHGAPQCPCKTNWIGTKTFSQFGSIFVRYFSKTVLKVKNPAWGKLTSH